MKIVSLLPSATEIACALGLREHLAAISHECDFPAGVEALPHITDSILPHGLSQEEIDARVSQALREGRPLYTVNGELLEEIGPDLILTQGVCDVCAVNEDTIRTAMIGLPEHVVAQAQLLAFTGRSTEGVFRDVLALGRAAGVETYAAEVVDALRDRWATLAQTPAVSPKPSVLLLEWAEPPFSAGHWVPEQIQVAGGRSALGGPGQDSRRLQWSEVADADPDIIAMIACGFGLEDNTTFARALYTHPQARQLRAVQAKQVWALDANSFFSRPAPRLVRGAEVLRAMFAEGRAVDGQSCQILP